MIGHELFGLLGTIVVGAIVIAAFKNGSGTGQVIKAGGDAFTGAINAMTQGGGSSSSG